MSAAKILVVDDTPSNVKLLADVLGAKGYAVVTAASGADALEVVERERPDLVLLDVMMPRMDGWQVLEQLLEDDATREIPIIFLTARAEVRDRARGLELGGVDYVTKPFNPIELAPLVEDLVARVGRGERDSLRREKIAELRELAERE